jgi:hypothetical protein
MINKQEFPGRIEYRNENVQYHRLDGPDIECSNGGKWCCLNGKYYTEQQ